MSLADATSDAAWLGAGRACRLRGVKGFGVNLGLTRVVERGAKDVAVADEPRAGGVGDR